MFLECLDFSRVALDESRFFYRSNWILSGWDVLQPGFASSVIPQLRLHSRQSWAPFISDFTRHTTLGLDSFEL